MVSIERGKQHRPTPTRRTEGDSRRRQALADAAAGISLEMADVPGKATGIRRFRCAIYLRGLPHASIAELRRECTEYAEMFCWEIAAVIEDDAGVLPPEDRPGLRQAIAHIRSGEAGAVVTAWRSMVSPVAQEYDQVAHEIEQAGGFLHVMESARGGPGSEPD